MEESEEKLTRKDWLVGLSQLSLIGGGLLAWIGSVVLGLALLGFNLPMFLFLLPPEQTSATVGVQSITITCDEPGRSSSLEEAPEGAQCKAACAYEIAYTYKSKPYTHEETLLDFFQKGDKSSCRYEEGQALTIHHSKLNPQAVSLESPLWLGLRVGAGAGLLALAWAVQRFVKKKFKKRDVKEDSMAGLA